MLYPDSELFFNSAIQIYVTGLFGLSKLLGVCQYYNFYSLVQMNSLKYVNNIFNDM